MQGPLYGVLVQTSGIHAEKLPRLGPLRKSIDYFNGKVIIIFRWTTKSFVIGTALTTMYKCSGLQCPLNSVLTKGHYVYAYN